MKLKYASAYTDNNDIDNSLHLPIDQDRQVESRKFIEIVEGRLEEIIENVWYQIPNDYYDKLLGGIILTGGGANMKNIEKAFQTNEDIKSHNGMMNTVLGLLAKGELNCAGGVYDPNGSLFDSPDKPTVPGDQRPPRQPGETPPGVVRSEAEKLKAEEEARKKKAEEERIAAEKEAQRLEEERKKKEEEERIRRENSRWNKFIKKVKKFGTDIVSEDE